jgi:hypothetical protein
LICAASSTASGSVERRQMSATVAAFASVSSNQRPALSPARRTTARSGDTATFAPPFPGGGVAEVDQGSCCSKCPGRWLVTASSA